MIKLYHTNCPVCKGIEFKLKKLNIEYEDIPGEEGIKNLGYSSSPVIEYNGKFYVGGKECFELINTLEK